MTTDIGANLTAVIIAALALIGSVVTAVLGYKANKKIDAVADGMKTAMIEAQKAETTAVAHAVGLAEGEAKELARAKP